MADRASIVLASKAYAAIMSRSSGSVSCPPAAKFIDVPLGSRLGQRAADEPNAPVYGRLTSLPFQLVPAAFASGMAGVPETSQEN